MEKQIKAQFVLPPSFNIEKVAIELKAIFGKDLTLITEIIDNDEAPWLSGQLKLNGLSFQVFLNLTLIEQGSTPAEQEYIRNRNGHSDVYQLIVTGPNTVNDLQSKVDSFLRHLGAKTFNGHSYAWSDY